MKSSVLTNMSKHRELVLQAAAQQTKLEVAFQRLIHQETWDDTLDEFHEFEEELEHWKSLVESVVEACKDADE